MAEIAKPFGWNVLKYIARQSLISAFSQVDLESLTIAFPESHFQQRALKEDIRSSLVESLNQSLEEIDYLIWDLADERLGVFGLHPSGYITRSYEMLELNGMDFVPEKGRLIDFGTDEHFNLWCNALEKFNDFLNSKNLLEKTILWYVPWAFDNIDGTPAPQSFRLNTVKINLAYVRYYQQVIDTTSIRVISPPDELVLADPNHKWGPAPFHYQNAVYESLIEQL
ncbi:hypothetical protein BK816_00445 [Boudabousia tangfeifanii]|uniref:Uncharacterized protein n=2 Tax=Boudabousia tangfeifanii TaxID=1912795 RepID=A0A1D9MM70_9ACTO|nr:hypothetical protein BK816_00445 [Boudabousia tangfeifanii]